MPKIIGGDTSIVILNPENQPIGPVHPQDVPPNLDKQSAQERAMNLPELLGFMVVSRVTEPGNRLCWYAFLEAEPTEFQIYRSFVGFHFKFVGNLFLKGDVLAFAVNNSGVQTVTLSEVFPTIDGIINDFNTIAKGARAFKSPSGDEIYVRALAGESPKIKIVPCEIAEKAGITPRMIAAQSEFELLGKVATNPSTRYYEYIDERGSGFDHYYLTSVRNSVGSLPSLDAKPWTGDLNTVCLIEGRLVDVSGQSVAGAQIKASAAPLRGDQIESAEVTQNEVSTVTDELGRWALTLLRNQSILLHIDSIGYNQVIETPNNPFVLFKDLAPLAENISTEWESSS